MDSNAPKSRRDYCQGWFSKTFWNISSKNVILKPYKNFPKLETVKAEMKNEKNRILESKRPLMEIN